MEAQFLYGTPQQEISSLIASYIRSADQFSIVVGFLTEEGVALLASAIKSRPGALKSLVVGSCTLKALNGLDQLIELGVSEDSLNVHLGFSRKSSQSARNPFILYHPMMHSKLYLFEMIHENIAIIGSHNITGYALSGQNGEASVQLRFSRDHKMYADIKEHITSAANGSIKYNPAMKLAYAWWYQQYTKGLEAKILFGNGEEDIEFARTILAIATMKDSKNLIKQGDRIYLEIPVHFNALNALGDPVHLYLFNKALNSPQQALAQLRSNQTAFEAKVVGTNTAGVVQQGLANWIIKDFRNPIVEPVPGIITTQPNPNVVQVFVEITGTLTQRYDYLFENTSKWEPVFDMSSEVGPSPAHRELFRDLNLIPPEHNPWYRVIGLRAIDTKMESSDKAEALRETSPEAGRYIMYSRRRRYIKRDR